MGYLEHKEKLDSLLYFIKSKSAADVDSLSKKLNVSRRTILRMVDLIKLQGIDLRFCKKRKVYFIEE
jgi:predicted DNA-binding transcriptional regulator YafY